MGLIKYASLEQAQVLSLKGSQQRDRTASLDKISEFADYRTEDGYLYARIRAISSRVNKNHDGWPSVELAGDRSIFDQHVSGRGFTVEAKRGEKYGFSTFLGKPIFVDHNNSNPDRARGVIVDAKLHVEDHRVASELDPYYASAPDEHMPPTWVELLLEVDAHSFPKLAKAIVEGSKNPHKGIDGFSMGCDVEKSVCNICKNAAEAPDEYCKHVKLKGAEFDWINPKTGRKESKKSYEDCYGIKFFEISAVFDPADETALIKEVRSSIEHEADMRGVACPHCQGQGHLGGLPCEHCEGTGVMGQAPYGSDGSMMQDTLNPPPGYEFPQLPGQRNYGKTAMVKEAPGKEHMKGVSPKRNRQYEHIKEQLMADGKSEEEAKEEAARTVNKQRSEHGETKSHRTAEHPLPQSDMMTAPEYVDTLRESEVCPVCGSDMDEGHQCDVCGYVAPPDGLDNPDLDKAQETNLLQDPQDLGNPAESVDVQTHPSSPDAAQPGGPPQPTNLPVAASVTDEKVSGQINPVERPIQTKPRPATNEPTEKVISDSDKPVTAASMIAAFKPGDTMEDTRTAADAPTADTRADGRVDATGVGGVMDSNNPAASKADKQVDVEGKGGLMDASNEEASRADRTENLDTAAEGSDDSGYNKDKTTQDSGKTKTFDNSNEPDSAVTGEAFPTSSWKIAYDDGPWPPDGEDALGGGSAKQGVDPADPVGKADERVDVMDHVTSPENNSGKTKTWSGTDGNGVTKMQPPVTTEVYAPFTASVVEILKVADTEVELGLIDPAAKYDRIAELEQVSQEVVQATAAVLARVKTAGLKKKNASTKQGGVGRVPSFSRQAAASHEESDESLFM